MASDDRTAMIVEFRQVTLELSWSALRLQAKVLEPYGLTTLQGLALRALASGGDDLDMARLAEMTSLPPSTLTSIVDRLERDGLAARHRDEVDRRRVLVRLTDRGEAVMQELEAMAVRLTGDMLREVADADLALLSAMTRRMMASIERMEREGAVPSA
jgi:DNA-binding MarR family transcriptional regulator